MFKNYIIAICLFLFVAKSSAQMNICVYAANDSLHFLYKADKDYTSAPTNFWNSQLVTVRYPKTVVLTWGAITQLSNFSWEEDPQTPGAGKDGNDGFFYKTFYTSNTPTEMFIQNTYKKVFRVKYNTTQPVVFQPITSNVFTILHHLDAAVNNAVEPGVLGDGNIFKAFLADCSPIIPVVDLDGDTFTGVNDPDDNCNRRKTKLLHQ